VCRFLCSSTGYLLNPPGSSNVSLPPAQFVYGGYQILNAGSLVITSQPLCEPPVDEALLPFSSVLFFYSDNEATGSELTDLRSVGAQNSVHVRWRGPQFAREHSAGEKPVAFISHDSRDKADIARPLAVSLQKKLCPVWFDEFSLKVGDSLREKIEDGIRKCARSILILSPHFLSNQGWTKTEFAGIFTREILERRRVVLPVWCGVTAKDVFEYSPSLADVKGIDWSLGIDTVSHTLYSVLFDATVIPPPFPSK
jgi:TIR domain